jgi:hypothetical protein
MRAERRATPGAPRPSFATLARTAIEKHVPESRQQDAAWHEAPNTAWVRWHEGNGYFYLGIHRHLNWLNGEVGASDRPLDLGELPLADGPHASDRAVRVRLGDLLEGDRWWRAGSTLEELGERLDWIALQLGVRGQAWMRRLGRAEVAAGLPARPESLG